MNKIELQTKVKQIIVKKLDLKEDKIDDKSNFQDDFGADSLDIIEIIMSFESEFKIEISDDEVEKLKTVKNAIDLVSSLVK